MRADGAPAGPGTTTRPAGAPGRREAALLALAALVVGGSIALLALGLTGGLVAGDALFDPGALVRYGLPIVRLIHDLAAAATVGFLVTATWIVSARPDPDPNSLGGARDPLARAAVVSSIIWALAGVAGIVLTAADVSGLRIGSPGFASVVVSFVGQVDLGRELGVSVLAVIVTANLTILATRLTALAWAALFSIGALLPLALTGHAAGARDHMNAVDSLAFHLVGVCLWVGGLAALLYVAGRLGDQLPTVVARYSRLAGWCFLTVALSGIVNAMFRLGSLAGLATPYGILIIGKTLALGALGLAGLAHRRYTIRRIGQAGHEHWFTRLASVEVVLMAGTIGLAIALSESAPPVPDTALDPVSALLGYPAPPPLTAWTYLTQFYPDLLWLAVAVVFAGCYLAGAIRLWRRGDRWSKPRTAAWLAGCLMLIVVTCGGIGVYSRLHFSTHMLQHMMLMIVVPFCWVVGAPITLALRSLRGRTDGSLGPRETLLRVVHSRVLKVLGHPLFSEAFFIVSLIAFYYTLPVRRGDVHPRRPRVDDRPLPARRLSLRLVADRYRPGAGPAAVPVPAAPAADGAGLPRLLRDHHDDVGNTARTRLVACPGPYRRRSPARRSAARRRDRLGCRGPAQLRPGHRLAGGVVLQRPAGEPAAGPPRGPGRRRRSTALQRAAGGDAPPGHGYVR